MSANEQYVLWRLRASQYYAGFMVPPVSEADLVPIKIVPHGNFYDNEHAMSQIPVRYRIRRGVGFFSPIYHWINMLQSSPHGMWRFASDIDNRFLHGEGTAPDGTPFEEVAIDKSWYEDDYGGYLPDTWRQTLWDDFSVISPISEAEIDINMQWMEAWRYASLDSEMPGGFHGVDGISSWSEYISLMELGKSIYNSQLMPGSSGASANEGGVQATTIGLPDGSTSNAVPPWDNYHAKWPWFGLSFGIPGEWADQLSTWNVYRDIGVTEYQDKPRNLEEMIALKSPEIIRQIKNVSFFEGVDIYAPGVLTDIIHFAGVLFRANRRTMVDVEVGTFNLSYENPVTIYASPLDNVRIEYPKVKKQYFGSAVGMVMRPGPNGQIAEYLDGSTRKWHEVLANPYLVKLPDGQPRDTDVRFSMPVESVYTYDKVKTLSGLFSGYTAPSDELRQLLWGAEGAFSHNPQLSEIEINFTSAGALANAVTMLNERMIPYDNRIKAFIGSEASDESRQWETASFSTGGHGGGWSKVEERYNTNWHHIRSVEKGQEYQFDPMFHGWKLFLEYEPKRAFVLPPVQVINVDGDQFFNLCGERLEGNIEFLNNQLLVFKAVKGDFLSGYSFQKWEGNCEAIEDMGSSTSIGCLQDPIDNNITDPAEWEAWIPDNELEFRIKKYTEIKAFYKKSPTLSIRANNNGLFSVSFDTEFAKYFGDNTEKTLSVNEFESQVFFGSTAYIEFYTPEGMSNFLGYVDGDVHFPVVEYPITDGSNTPIKKREKLAVGMFARRKITGEFLLTPAIYVSIHGGDGRVVVVEQAPDGTEYIEEMTRNKAYRPVYPESTVSVAAHNVDDYEFALWTGDIYGNESSAYQVILTPSLLSEKQMKKISVTATYVAKPILTVTESPAGVGGVTVGAETISGSAEFPVERGTSKTLSAAIESNSSHYFSRWTGDVASTDESISVTINEDTEITALFQLKPSILALSIVGNGLVYGLSSKSGNFTAYGRFEKRFFDDETITLDSFPGSDSYFLGYTGDVESEVSNTSFGIEDGKSATANFDLKPVLTLEKVGSGDGTFSYTGGEEADTYAQVTAIASEGSYFTGWYGDASGRNNPLSIFMDKDKTVLVGFILNPFTVSIQIIGNGRVEWVLSGEVCIEDCQKTASPDSVFQLRAIPDNGNYFDGYSGDYVHADKVLDVSGLDGDKSIIATFKETHGLTIEIIGDGLVSVED